MFFLAYLCRGYCNCNRHFCFSTENACRRNLTYFRKRYFEAQCMLLPEGEIFITFNSELRDSKDFELEKTSNFSNKKQWINRKTKTKNPTILSLQNGKFSEMQKSEQGHAVQQRKINFKSLKIWCGKLKIRMSSLMKKF